MSCPNVKKCIVVKRTGNYINWDQNRDVWYHDLIKDVPNHCEPEEMNAEDPLFILYTSGSTGKPKGVLHTTGGYMVYASMTHQYIFNYKPKDIYWCTADIGWVTGHSYIIYGPLSNGATTIMFEGVPNYCEPEEMNAEDPLFILYTSGSTGKPKGVLHTTGGYMVYASMTHQYIFNYKPKDIYWCTADICLLYTSPSPRD